MGSIQAVDRPTACTIRSVHRFYAPDLALDQEVPLSPDEAHHLARVLRLKPGDSVALFDGRGHEALARVETMAGRRVTVRALEKRAPAPEPAIALTLAQALLKSNKMDRVIRDAVMLGVAAIQPFVSIRTEVPRAALGSGVRQERWDRTVMSSVKQSGRAVVPPVGETQDFHQLLSADATAVRVMFVEPGHEAGARSLNILETRVPARATILIGPEGGWDPQEVKAAVAAGVTLVRFGGRVLRADAAGAAAIAVLQYLWKDL
jgi:16S rRNA (uracil1498-N3)-methyltransferase